MFIFNLLSYFINFLTLFARLKNTSLNFTISLTVIFSNTQSISLLGRSFFVLLNMLLLPFLVSRIKFVCPDFRYLVVGCLNVKNSCCCSIKDDKDWSRYHKEEKHVLHVDVRKSAGSVVGKVNTNSSLVYHN